MSDKMKITTKILKLLARYTPAPASDDIDLDTDIAGLELDSLAMFEVVFEIEECFAVELDEAELTKITTVRDLISSVQAAMGRYRSCS